MKWKYRQFATEGTPSDRTLQGTVQNYMKCRLSAQGSILAKKIVEYIYSSSNMRLLEGSRTN
jgi:hypothetical protein